MNGHRRVLRRVLAALCCATDLALVACSSSHQQLGAAEPAIAPTSGPAVAGSLRAVGAAPEGIVYDPITNLLAVAVRNPNRLLLLDPSTLTTVRTVPLPGTVRHLQLAAAGGPVLVPVESADELLEVSLPGGAIRATRVGKQPHDATGVAGGRIVVGNEFSSSISILRDGQLLATLPQVRQPGSVIGDGSTVAVVDVGAFTVSTFDVDAEKRTAVLPAGSGPTHGVLVSGDRVVVVDTRGDAVLVYGLDPLKRLSRTALRGSPYGMAVDPATNTVWITLTARNQVVGLDVTGTTPREVARYSTVRQPDTISVAPGSHTLWITGTATGQVQRITR